MVESKSGSRNNRHKNLIFVSLLVVVLIVSLCVYMFFVNNDGAFVSTVHVKSETELVKAIDAVNVGESVVITIDNDIQLSTELKIPAYKEVTFINNKDNQFSIIGAENAIYTIEVERGGTLTLNGLVITHKNSANGAGISNHGIFNMRAGEISGNTAGVYNHGIFNLYDGQITNNIVEGGVQNMGTFNMYNGEISNNHATGDRSGAGVSNYGSFIMYNGVISNNQAAGLGGGVMNGVSDDVFFEMLDGEISGNRSYRSGGGVFNYSIFKMSGGTITGNTATWDGGGVYTWPYTDDAEFIMTGGVVTGNTANNCPDIYPK
jgi:hypothetical protein